MPDPTYQPSGDEIANRARLTHGQGPSRMPELLLGLVGVPRVDQGNDDGEEPRRGTKQQGLGPECGRHV
jgi:hypothetical protein